jgi:hypothetical protein
MTGVRTAGRELLDRSERQVAVTARTRIKTSGVAFGMTAACLSCGLFGNAENRITESKAFFPEIPTIFTKSGLQSTF